MTSVALLTDSLGTALHEAMGSSLRILSASEMRGGDINQAFALETTDGPYFVKCNEACYADMFDAEADALAALAACRRLRVPRVVCTGNDAVHAFLILEFISLSNTTRCWSALGEGLAELHSLHAAEYGWHRNNTIGLTPQSNAMHTRWLDFWREERLQPQLALAGRHGAARALVDAANRHIGLR